MKTGSGPNQKFITAAACAAALTALAAIAPHARAEYGTEFTFSLAISFNARAYGIASGQAVGFDSGSAWLWSSPAVNLNPPGLTNSVARGTSGPQQVGYASSGTSTRAILWSGTATSAVDLTPAAGFSGAAAWGIGGGKEVGYGIVTGGNRHALLWSGTAASKVDLNPAGFVSSAAVATSGTQQVGNAVDGSANSHPILWSGTAASAVDLTPPGFSSSTVTLTGVANGQQVGYSDGQALLWSGTAASYADLTPTGSFAQAYATNGTQQVGFGSFRTSDDAVYDVALVWSGTADSAVNLNNFIPGGQSYDNHYATSIDAYGNVTGYGHNQNYNFEEGPIEWLNGNLYKTGGTGAWATTTNWMSGTPANGQDVMLLQADATNRTITYTNSNSAIVLGKLTIDATGTGAMTLAQAQDSLKTTSESIGVVGKGVFTQTGGTHAVSGTLTLAERAGSSGSYTISGGALSAGAASINSNGILNYNGGGCSLGDLALNGTGRLIVSAGSGKVLTTKSIVIDAGAKLDLNNNAIIVDWTGASPLTAIANQIKAGYAAGAWTGNGITSSSAASSSSSVHKTSLGYLDNTTAGLTTFHGQAVDPTSVLIGYVYAGDANLDGKVDTLDFNSLAGNFGGTGKVWSQADFNYDGVVDTLDFNNLSSNFGQQLAQTGETSLVPEPHFGVALMVALLTLRKRRA